MTHVPSTALADLITLGRSGDLDLATEALLAARLKPYSRLNCLGWNEWDEVTAEMPQENLESLMRGLILAEKLYGWVGGSVAAGIWVFGMYQRRFPAHAGALADWALANSDNPWIPYGSNRGSARSVAEYREQCAAKARRQQARAQESEMLRQHRRIRESVRHRLAVERMAKQTAASRAREELLQALRSVPVTERVEHIAWDNTHPVEFYPVDLITASTEELRTVDSMTWKMLVEKAESRRRGPWRKWVRKVKREIESF